MKKILIIWQGLTSCTLLISDVLRSKDYETDLVYTSSAMPFEGIERTLNKANKIIKVESIESIASLNSLKNYDLIITTGWKSRKLNNALADLKKVKPELINVCAIDNKLASDLILNIDNKFNHTFIKQALGALYFRFKLTKTYDYCFVPGNCSNRLLRLFGQDSHKIVYGYYGAHQSIYKTPEDFENKENCFLFVGQLITRKGISILLKAFSNYQEKGGTWNLKIIGGNFIQYRKFSNNKFNNKIQHISFAQPEVIALEMRRSKVFILPSIQDNWGTVACEAAISGCFLIISEQSGSASDLVKKGINGYTFNAKSKNSFKTLSNLMVSVEKLSMKESFFERLKISAIIGSTFNAKSYKLAIDNFFVENI